MKLIFVIFLCTFSTVNVFGEGHKNAIQIKASEYKTGWPFKGTEYSLGCITRQNRPLVYVSDVEEGEYGINGAARGYGKNLFGWKDSTALLKKNKTMADLDVFIKKGLKLCGM